MLESAGALLLGWQPQPVWDLSVVFLAGGCATAACVTDLRSREIPHAITVGGGAAMLVLLGSALTAGLLTGAPPPAAPLRAGVLGLAIGAAYLALALLPGEGLGGGDVKLAPILGAGLGWFGTVSAVLGVLFYPFLLAAAGLAVMGVRRRLRRSSSEAPVALRHLRIPFAPWLLAGWLLALLTHAT